MPRLFYAMLAALRSSHSAVEQTQHMGTVHSIQRPIRLWASHWCTDFRSPTDCSDYRLVETTRDFRTGGCCTLKRRLVSGVLQLRKLAEQLDRGCSSISLWFGVSFLIFLSRLKSILSFHFQKLKNELRFFATSCFKTDLLIKECSIQAPEKCFFFLKSYAADSVPNM